MQDDSSLILALLAGLLAMGVCLVWLIFGERRRREQIKQLERNLIILKQTVGALCSSAVGVDRRVNRVEQHGRDLQERQDSIENRKHSDPPYADAIRLVKEGADADRLVRDLGLNRGAADLIIMLHGMRREDRIDN